MKKLAFLFSLAALLAFAACRDGQITMPTNNTLHLSFKATFGDEQLKKETDYAVGIYPVQFSRFTLYVTGVSLLNGADETPLADAQFLDFFPESASGNLSQILKFDFANIPEGKYTGLKIGFGVRSDLNAKTPAEFPAGSPLALTSEFWAGWHSYIFSKIEAKSEIDHTNPNDYETFLTYHCGSASNRDIFRSYDFSNAFTMSDNYNEIAVELNLKKLLTDGSGNALNLSKPSNQVTGATTADLSLAELFMANWETATSVK